MRWLWSENTQTALSRPGHRGGRGAAVDGSQGQAAPDAVNDPDPVVALEPDTLPEQPLTAAKAAALVPKEIG